MGVVYAAQHPVTKDKVAIKLLNQDHTTDAEAISRFFSEAKISSTIGHEHIVVVSSVGYHGDTPYFVMEYLEGEPLSLLLERRESLSFSVTIDIILQLLSALNAAHQRGIIHRDLKPENIFLLRNPQGYFVKLLDFGIAKLIGQNTFAKPVVPLTKAGEVIGTPYYMAPEQFRGHQDRVDPRADLYSVGVLMFEMLCGQLPFPEQTFGELAVAHVQTQPPRPRTIKPEISNELEAFLLKALAKKREERFSSALAMAEELTAVFSLLSIQGNALTLPGVMVRAEEPSPDSFLNIDTQAIPAPDATQTKPISLWKRPLVLFLFGFFVFVFFFALGFLVVSRSA